MIQWDRDPSRLDRAESAVHSGVGLTIIGLALAVIIGVTIDASDGRLTDGDPGCPPGQHLQIVRHQPIRIGNRIHLQPVMGCRR